MFDQSQLWNLVAIGASLLVLVGCWRLRRRLPNRASNLLFFSVVALFLLGTLSSLIGNYVLANYEHSSFKSAFGWLVFTGDEVAPVVLLLVAFVCWLLVVRSVGSPIRTSRSVGLLFATLFLIVLLYASWFIGLHFALAYLPGLQVPLLAAALVASVGSLTFWLGARRKASTHSPAAVLTFAIALFFIFTSANKLFLPGVVAPLLLMAAAGFLFGTMGFVVPAKAAAG